MHSTTRLQAWFARGLALALLLSTMATLSILLARDAAAQTRPAPRSMWS